MIIIWFGCINDIVNKLKRGWFEFSSKKLKMNSDPAALPVNSLHHSLTAPLTHSPLTQYDYDNHENPASISGVSPPLFPFLLPILKPKSDVIGSK